MLDLPIDECKQMEFRFVEPDLSKRPGYTLGIPA
jgi:hypothetical protein